MTQAEKDFIKCKGDKSLKSSLKYIFSFDNTFYQKTLSQLQSEECKQFPSHFEPTLNSKIEMAEVIQQINRTKTKKSPGLDKIHNNVLKNSDVAYAIFVLLKHCFSDGQMQGIWLRAIIPKGAEKDPCCPKSYRGINLLSSICKIYTGILNNIIGKYLEAEKIICPEL